MGFWIQWKLWTAKNDIRDTCVDLNRAKEKKRNGQHIHKFLHRGIHNVSDDKFIETLERSVKRQSDRLKHLHELEYEDHNIWKHENKTVTRWD